MAKTLLQILGYQNLTGIIQDPRGGIPDNLLPLGLTQRGMNVEGDTAYYWKVDGTRKTARIAHYGSPSKRRDMKGLSKVPVKLMHTIESMHHDPNILDLLSNMNDATAQGAGMQEISRQVASFNALFNNLLVAAIYQAFSLGAIYFDADGNLLPSSSGADLTIDYGIPAGNKGGCDILGTGAIIGTPWSNAAADIIGDVKAIQAAIAKKTGYPLRHVLYGENVYGYLAGNTALKNLILGSPQLSQAFATGEIPQGFLGLSWWPVHTAFFEDQDGTLQSLFGADQCTFLPDPSPEWYEVLNGSYRVPTTLGAVVPDASAAAGLFAKVYGRFSYATITDDPAGIKHVAGDTLLPVIKVPNAVVLADTTP